MALLELLQYIHQIAGCVGNIFLRKIRLIGKIAILIYIRLCLCVCVMGEEKRKFIFVIIFHESITHARIGNTLV